MNEQDLILALQRGDESAFAELIARHEKKVYNLCLRMLANEHDAEEAAQDAFLALWRSIGDFRGESSLSTWLYRLASNACIDLMRKNRRAANDVSIETEEGTWEIADESATPHEELERKEQLRSVREGLDALPPEYRQVLILRELQQLSYQEIVDVTGLELGTVKSRISRARQLLKNYLTASGNFFESPASKTGETNAAQGKEGAK